jgi:hypothetical protein
MFGIRAMGGNRKSAGKHIFFYINGMLIEN